MYYFWRVNQTNKKLTNRDIAFGIGRKASQEELQQYLNTAVGKFVDSKTALNDIKANLQQRRNKRKAS